jgi:omega-amidase
MIPGKIKINTPHYTIFLILRGIEICMENLRVTWVQTELAWEDPAANLQHFRDLLAPVKDTDLILLPEMFNTAFSINPARCSEPPDGPSSAFLQEIAVKKGCAVAGTLITKVGRHHFNRLHFYFPDGTLETYDKRHLFRLSEEFRIFRGGDHRKIIRYKGWKILPLVCYDLRFPVWSKNRFMKGEYEYDFLFYLSNWPYSRAYAWKSLLVARAIENQAYVAGVNRIGNDGFGTWHSGSSLVADAKGRILAEAGEGMPSVQTVSLDYSELQLFRDSFTVGMDWDQFTINP